MSCTVKDVMSTHIFAVRKGAPYKEMAAVLAEQRISAFPVIDEDNKVIGVVSETDLLPKEVFEGTAPRTLESLAHQRLRAQVNGLTAADLMSSPAVTISPDKPVVQAARLMFNCKVKRLPVVSDDGKLIGIVSRADVLSVYRVPDSEIQRRVTQDLILGTIASDPLNFTVTVQEGIVTIAGKPETYQAGLDIIRAIRHMEGVVFVRDRLSYPPNPTYRPQMLPG